MAARVLCVKYVTVNGQTFTVLLCWLLTKRKQIQCSAAIYIVDEKPVLFVSVFDTQKYSNHFHAYIVVTCRHKTILVECLFSLYVCNVLQSCVHSLFLNII